MLAFTVVPLLIGLVHNMVLYRVKYCKGIVLCRAYFCTWDSVVHGIVLYTAQCCVQHSDVQNSVCTEHSLVWSTMLHSTVLCRIQ